MKDYFDINGDSLRDASPVWKARFNSSDDDSNQDVNDSPPAINITIAETEEEKTDISGNN